MFSGDRALGCVQSDLLKRSSISSQYVAWGINRAVAEAECNTVIDLKLEHDAA
jgi:hypothetical protein